MRDRAPRNRSRRQEVSVVDLFVTFLASGSGRRLVFPMCRVCSAFEHDLCWSRRWPDVRKCEAQPAAFSRGPNKSGLKRAADSPSQVLRSASPGAAGLAARSRTIQSRQRVRIIALRQRRLHSAIFSANLSRAPPP